MNSNKEYFLNKYNKCFVDVEIIFDNNIGSYGYLKIERALNYADDYIKSSTSPNVIFINGEVYFNRDYIKLNKELLKKKEEPKKKVSKV